MDYFQILLLSIIEGITEFLPVSSTGHLILASDILGLAQSEFFKSFEIIIQSGAILGVVLLYWKTLFKDRDYLKKIIVAFVPTGIIGFILYKLIKEFLLGNLWVTVLALLLGGIAIFTIEKYFQKKKEGSGITIHNLSYSKTLLIGVIQSLSVIPGVSRSAATILGGMGLGLKREAAVEFSFLLAIPTMFAATGYDLLKSADQFKSDDFLLLAFGFIISMITAIISVKWFIGFVKTNTLIPFAIYRILLAVIFLIFLL
jgi:undecaprenyl-diphosphatase